MPSCIENRTSGEFVQCHFSATATICQSSVHSMPTAVCYHNQNSAHHILVLSLLVATILILGTACSGGGSKGNIIFAVYQDTIMLYNVSYNVLAHQKARWWVVTDVTIIHNFWTKRNYTEPSNGQIGLWKANLFPVYLGKKEEFKGSKTEISVKMVRFCKVCLLLGCVYCTALYGRLFLENRLLLEISSLCCTEIILHHNGLKIDSFSE